MNGAETVIALLSGSIIVMGGMGALARVIWAAAQDVRDNMLATQANTRALGELSTQMDSRFTALETRVAALERNKP